MWCNETRSLLMVSSNLVQWNLTKFILLRTMYLVYIQDKLAKISYIMYIGSLIKVWFIPDSGLVKIRLRQALTVKVTAGFNLWLYTISWTTGHKLELCACMPITQDSLKRNSLLDAVIGGLLQDFHPLFVSTILSYLWQWNYIPYSYTSATFIHNF